MRLTPCLSFLAVLVLSTACDKGQSNPGKETIAPPKPTLASSPQAVGPLELPAGVPVDAAAVFTVRLPSPIFAAIVNAGPMRFPAGTPPELRQNLDGLLEKAVGMRLLDASTITGFSWGDREFALLLPGVDSRIRLNRSGEHRGVPLFRDKDSHLRLAQLGNLLVVGTERATRAAIDANRDTRFSAQGGELARLIQETSDGASMVVAANLSKLDPSFKRGLPQGAQVDYGLLIFGSESVAVVAEGAEDKLEGLARALNAFRPTMSDEDFVASAVDGKTLRLEFPEPAQDPTRLVATVLPAVAKYMRRARAFEAPQHLGRIADSAASYFNNGIVNTEDASGTAPHSCPNDGTLAGETGITPPVSVDCSAGPAGRCVPASDDATLPGDYPLSAWHRSSWNGLNFQQEQGHFFHYNFIWKNAKSGFGACQFTAQAFGDLDGDGVFSTYERYGVADEDGVKHAAGLFIDHELE